MKRSDPSSSETRVFSQLLAIRAEGDTITAALSSETPVPRAFGKEILDHGAIDMSRANVGLPLIVQHDANGALPVGRVQNIRVDPDRVMRGELTFSQRPEAQSIRQDVIDKIITDVSVGYRVDPKQVTKTGDTYRFRNWTPYEASLVSIAADPSAGINRGDPEMETETTPASETPKPATDELAIRQAFERFITRDGVAELQRTQLEAGASAVAATQALLDHLGRAGAAEPGPAASVIEVGEESKEKFHRAAENAILIRSGLANEEEAEHGKANPLTGYSMVELARAWAHENHIDVMGLNSAQLISRAIDPGTANLATSDFAAILEGVLNKGLFRGFDEAKRTWDTWASTNSVTDFKAYTRPGLSHFTSLALVAENAAIADGIRNDKKETGTLGTYARKFSITREAMVNDDLSAFSDNARAMGEAAQRTIDELVYTELQLNTGAGPTMLEDAVAMFSVLTHANLITTGGAPDEAAFIVGKVAMSAQVDTNSIQLGIRPAFLMCPIELEDACIKLVGAEFSPDGSANPFEPNAVRGQAIVVSSHLITDKNSWYLMGPRGTTMEVNFLNGQQSPSIERDTGWSTFALHWRVWIDADVIALDWRAGFKNEGGV